MFKEEYEVKEIPEAPAKWRTLRERIRWLGPGFIMGGLSVGTGELITCSVIGARWGGALAWVILLTAVIKACTLWLAMRYAALTGEHTLRLLSRITRVIPWILLISFFFSEAFFYSGAATSAGTALTELTGVGDYRLWGYVTMAVCAIVLFTPKIVYEWVENITKVTSTLFVLGGIMTSLVMVVIRADLLPEFIRGMFSFGYIPPGAEWMFVVMTGWGFASGIEDSIQYTFYTREKGYANCKYIPPITGYREKAYDVPVKGFMPATTAKSIENWKNWKSLLLGDFAVWLLQCLIGSLSNMWLGASVLRPLGLVPSGFKTAVHQAEYFKTWGGVAGYYLYLFLAALNIWDTQLTVYDADARTYSNGVYTTLHSFAKRRPLRDWYYLTVVIMLILGGTLGYFAEPDVFVYIGSATVVIFMWLNIACLILVNYKGLPKEFRPAWWIALLAGIGIPLYLYVAYAQIMHFMGLL